MKHCEHIEQKGSYNLNFYPGGSENHIAFNQGVCGVLDHSNEFTTVKELIQELSLYPPD